MYGQRKDKKGGVSATETLFLNVCNGGLLYGASYHGLMTYSFADDIIALITIALLIGVPIYTVIVTIRYILIISKKDVPTWKKVLWGIVLFEFNVWVFPMFWRRHIRIEPSEIEQEENLSATATYEKTEYTPSGLEYVPSRRE